MNKKATEVHYSIPKYTHENISHLPEKSIIKFTALSIKLFLTFTSEGK